MNTPKLYPAKVQPKKRKSLQPNDIDKLGQAILTLGQEIWTLTDRQIITEEVLKNHGINIRDEIDKYKPSSELEAELSKKRKALVKKIIEDINGEYGLLEQEE